MDADHPALLAIVRAISDGARVDWAAAESDASESFKQALVELRAIAEVASLNRSLSGGTDRQPAATTTLRPAPREPLARWGHLHLLEHVASGAFGDVYRAWDPAIDREVALKLVRPQARLQDEADETIEEGRLLARVHHPNVVAVYGAARVEGRVGIWMEFVHGRTLATVVQQDGPLPAAEVAAIGATLCDAVAAVHDAGLLHRDIKAQNVMLGPDGRVVLMDLGAGRAVDESTRDLAGTPLYLAPEVMSGADPTVRSDVYSVGVLLNYLATGTFRPASVPANLETIIGRATAPDPDMRFPNAAELAAALRAVLQPAKARGRTAALILAAVALTIAGVATVPAVRARFRGSLFPGDARERALAAPEAPMRVVQLTSMEGYAIMPDFSPDGRQVVFAHSSSRRGEHDTGIYVQAVGSGKATRLSPDHLVDKLKDVGPVWSPDGRHIAFVRWSRQSGADGAAATIHVMSPDGTGIRTIGDFPDLIFNQWPVSISWSPDSRFLLAARGRTSPAGTDGGIYLVPIDGSAPRQLTIAAGLTSQLNPVFSPRGNRFAFVSCAADPCEVDVADISPALRVTGAPWRVASASGPYPHLAWSRDGRTVIFDSATTTDKSYLWIVDADGGAPARRLEVAGNSVMSPAVSPVGNRLAFERYQSTDEDIYRLGPHSEATPVVSSSIDEYGGAVSPDGTMVAFETARANEREDIWLARVDGGGERQLTHGPNHWQGSPAWSPDGQRIAFDSLGPDGHRHIWAIGVAGGQPQQLTHGAGDQIVPSWSFDGKYVYFAATLDPEYKNQDMWRIRLDDGVEQQLTHVGSPGGTGFEVGRGKYLQFEDRNSTPLLFPLAGGPPRKLAACASDFGFRMGASESYYVDCNERKPALHAVDLATGRDRVLGTPPNFFSGTVSLSANGKVILYLYRDESRIKYDVMLLENFK